MYFTSFNSLNNSLVITYLSTTRTHRVDNTYRTKENLQLGETGGRLICINEKNLLLMRNIKLK